MQADERQKDKLDDIFTSYAQCTRQINHKPNLLINNKRHDRTVNPHNPMQEKITCNIDICKEIQVLTPERLSPHIQNAHMRI